jgi:glyoxylase-like metal-dependent hydrolase (beta-lactamase superfamily II)
MRENLERPIREVQLADGVWLEDEWYALKAVDAGTLAIGEPAYHQCNWSYLICDAGQGLLWDTGSGRRAIAPVVARHAGADVTAFPSHMHFDHLGGIKDFGPVKLADLAALRALEKGGEVTPPEEMYLGAYEGLSVPSFAVGQWCKPGEAISVGERQLQVIHTPGHSPDSVSLWEADRAVFYAADFIYPGEVYAQVPGASLHDYLKVLDYLLTLLPVQVEILCAHGVIDGGVSDVPRLGYGDLTSLRRAISSVLGTPPHDGELQVNDRMALLYSAASFSG